MGQMVNKDLGPCVMTYDGDNVGPTFGGVTFYYEEHSGEVREDEYGDTIIDEVFVGSECRLEAPITRATLAQLEKLLPNASLAGDTLTVSNPVGTSMRDNAKELVVKPIVDGSASSDSTTYLTIFLAGVKAAFEVGYDTEGQRVYNVIFRGLPVQTSGSEGQSWKIG